MFGLKMGWEIGVVLHFSHESSLPVSRTMVTFCGGVPTERDIVRVTLCLNGSLFGALGKDPNGISWVLRGKTSICVVETPLPKQSWVLMAAR